MRSIAVHAWMLRSRLVFALAALLLALAGVGRCGAADLAQNFGFGGTFGMNTAAAASTVDAAGNTYIAGNFEAVTFTLGAVTLSRVGVRDGFVAKLDPSGTVLWARSFGGDGTVVVVKSVAVDGSGNVYLGGSFSSGHLSVPALTRIGTSDAFAFKLDSAGNSLWTKNFGGAGAVAIGNAIAVDGSGKVYLGGFFYNANLTTPALTLTGSIDTFLLKLDSGGIPLWSRNHGGPGAGAVANGIAVDGAGNVYLGGYLYNANLTAPALTRIGEQDAFVLKTDVTGATLWSRNFGGLGAAATAGSVAVDGAGNVYLAGHFKDASLTTPALARIGTQDAFAIKLDAAGNRKWSKNYGGAGATATATAVAPDGSGNLYLAGYFSGARLTTPVLTRIGTQDAFALKLDSSGNTSWGRNYGGAGAQAFGSGIALDGGGNVYLGGYFQNASLTTPALTRIGTADVCAFKLTSSGSTTWARNFGGGYVSGIAGDAYVNATAVDAAGNMYIAGYFSASALRVGGTTLYRMGTADAFVVKLDAMGAVVWAKNHGGNRVGAYGVAAGAFGTGIAVDGAGNVYVGGYFFNADLTTPELARIGNDNAFALKLDSSGAIVWARAVGGAGASAFGNAIAVDAAGNVYLGGHFYGGNLTSPPITKIGSRDAFAVKLNSSGNPVWAKAFGGAGARATSNGIAVDGSGNVYLGGYLDSGDLTTPPLTKTGDFDALAVKLDSTGAVVWGRNYGGSGASAFGNGIAVDAGGNVYLGGYFTTASLTSPALARIGVSDAYAIKADSSGTLTWARNFGGGGADALGSSIAVDGAGNVLLGGYFSDANLTSPALTRTGNRDSFALKLNSLGTTTWARNHGGPGADTLGNGIAADAGGNVYLGGQFYGANLSTPALAIVGGTDAMIIRQTTKAAQTVSFGMPPSITAGGTGTVSAAASSGLAVTLASSTPDVCTLAGSVVTAIGAGVCTIRADQAGNAVYDEAPTATQSFAIALIASTATVSASATPTVFGQGVTFTANVTGSAPGGTVDFYDGQAALCLGATLTTGQATCQTAALAVGGHSITAAYGGDARNSPTSAAMGHTVNKASTTLSITSHTPDPSLKGAQVAVVVSLTATPPGAGAPGGSITVGDGSTLCMIATPATGCSLTLNQPGARTLTAAYGGNANYHPSTSPGVGHSVILPPTSITLSSSANPAVAGRLITFTATVTGNAPTGSVDFRAGGVSIGGCGSKTLSGGSATCATNALTPGRHSITAAYSGDAGNAASVSGTLTQRVVSKGALILPALLLLME